MGGEILEPEAEELLPKNWKIAYDNSGKRYYYHELTRKSQWDLSVEVIPTEIKNLENKDKNKIRVKQESNKLTSLDQEKQANKPESSSTAQSPKNTQKYKDKIERLVRRILTPFTKEK